MMAAALDHLWQSTLLALGAGLLVLVFRRARPAVRYGLWFAASAKFLVPFAALAAAGRLLAPAIPPPVRASLGAAFITQAAEPFSQVQAIAPAIHATPHLDPALILLAVWALGCAAVLARWRARWARVRSAMRSATPLALPAPMPVLASTSLLEPGLVGLWRPVLLVPATLFDRLARPEIEAIVAHEACHLRRRDNLTAAVHMLVEALFWFHPMVWWIGARLIEERERACDETVVRSGHDPAAYARALVECCRLYLQSPLPCVAGASGSDLKMRVERIMTASPSSPLPPAKKVLLLAAGVCAFATPVAAGLLASPAERQAAARAVAMASSPASVSAERPPSAPSGSDTSEATSAITPVRTDAPPAAKVQQIAARPQEPVQLETDAINATAPALAKPLQPVSRAEIPDARLIAVADTQLPEATPPLGPGHYVQRSGLKHSNPCGAYANEVDDYPIYVMGTPAVAPGRVITNFRFELVGDASCTNKYPAYTRSAYCELASDRPDKKTVRFKLFANGNQCPGADQSEVRRAEMVISYDVQ